MLKSNKSSSSLTPIETNTDVEDELGFYGNVPPKLVIATGSRTSLREVTSTVQIKVMDTESNGSDKKHVGNDEHDDDDDDDGGDDSDSDEDDDGEEEEEDDDDEEDDDAEDDSAEADDNNGKSGNQNDEAKNENDNQKVSNSGVGLKNEDQDSAMTGQNRAKSPEDQRIERQYNSNDTIRSERRDNTFSSDNGRPDKGNKDFQLESNVQYEGDEADNCNTHDTISKEPSHSSPINEIKPSNTAENLLEFKRSPSENHNNRWSNIENEEQPKLQGLGLSHENKDAGQTPDEKTGHDLSSRSDGAANLEDSLVDDFFDRQDSVEMSYFASFNEMESSKEKSKSKTVDITETQHDEDESQNTDRVSLDKASGFKTIEAEENETVAAGPSNKHSALFGENGRDTHEESVHSVLKSTTERSPKTETDAIGERNNDQNRVASYVITNSQQDVKNDSNDRTREYSGDLDNATLSLEANATLFHTSGSNENVQPGHDISKYDDADIDDKDDDDDNNDIGSDDDNHTGGLDLDKFPTLSEPDEQSILRVYISKNDQDQSEIDFTSELLQLSEDVQNDGDYLDSPAKRNNRRSKSSSKLAKNTQKDKKKTQSSPYSNPPHTFKFDGETKAIERLKHGPYAEVFKRDAPKVTTKSKGGQDNNKKSKVSEKSKPQTVKKDSKTNAVVVSPSKTKGKGKTIRLKKIASQKDKVPIDHIMSSSPTPNSFHEESEDESQEQHGTFSNEDTTTVEKMIKLQQPNVRETEYADVGEENNGQHKTTGEEELEIKTEPNQPNAQETDFSNIDKSTEEQDNIPEVEPSLTEPDHPQGLVEPPRQLLIPKVTVDESLLGANDTEVAVDEALLNANVPDANEEQKVNVEKPMEFESNEGISNKGLEGDVDNEVIMNPTLHTDSGPDEKPRTVDEQNHSVIKDIQSDDTQSDVKTQGTEDTTRPSAVNDDVQENSKSQTETDLIAENHTENKSNQEKETKITTIKNTKGNNDKQKASALRGSSAKKKIIISSPKTTAKMALKSKQMSEKTKTPQKVQSTKPNQKSDQKTKERKTSDTKAPSDVSNTQLDALEPAIITVIDETAELDEKVNGSRAGRLIINNIKNKLRKNSIKRHTSNSSVASVQLITSSRPSSPDEKGLNSSVAHQGGRPAYKTQSMSSLQVPGQLSASNPWDPTREEDTLSIGSRRPSMDSMSRKSVDYRIRNTTMVIQPHNDEKPKSVFTSDETYIQSAVPCLPMSLAVFCLFLNVVMPGSGTIISGLSVLCCGHSRLSNKEDQMLNALCANLFVGIAQLFTVSFMLVGWFWSISWGIKMVSVSARHREELKQRRAKDLQALALSAFGSPKRMNLFST